jgi:hypothetical protein
VKLPVKFNQLYRFIDNGQRFICDLTKGEVVEVSTALFEIIEACESFSLPQLLNHFQDRFSDEQIYTAIEELNIYAQAALLVAAEPSVLRKCRNERLRLLVLHDLMSPTANESMLWKVNRYVKHLLLLTLHAEIYFPVPQTLKDRFSFLENHVHISDWEPRRLYQNLRERWGTYDLLLDLCCETGFIFPLYDSNQPPILTLNPDLMIPSRNSTLAKAAMMRPFDAMLFESSWQRRWIQESVPDCQGLETATSGIILSDEVTVKTARAQILQVVARDSWKEKPIVGLFVDGKVGEVLRAAFDIATSNAAFNFLLLGVSRPTTTKSCPENLYCVGPRLLSDVSIWWQGLSLLCVIPGWTISLSYLLLALAYETPLVVCSESMPPEFEGASVWISSERYSSLSTFREKFSQVVHQILENPREQARLENLGKDKQTEFTPQNWVSKLTHICQESVIRYQNTYQENHVELPLLFCRHYNPTTTTDRTEAIVLSDSSRLTPKEGILEALAPECTLTEWNLLKEFLSQKISNR